VFLLPPSLRRACALLALGAAGLGLTGCTQVAVIKSAPVVATFDQKHGNDALAATDAADLEAGLRQRGQIWDLRFDTRPENAGQIDPTSQQSVLTGRRNTTALVLTLTATAQSTLDGFSARGPQGEQAYLQQLVQIIANAGYTRLSDIRVEVYFKSSHHATLTWTGTTNFVYKVLDGKP